MCTIILANQVFEDYTPVIAANRDEIYGRGSIPPRRTQIDDERWMIAPRDELEGGTWMGFNSDGILVGIANIWIQDGQSNDGDAYTSGEKMRSRGLLCDDVLRQTGLESARREIKESVSENEYNGFNLVVGSPKGAFGATFDGELRFVDFEPGFHVITNSPIDRPDEKALGVRRVVPTPEEGFDRWMENVKALLKNHELNVCIHEEDRGTRSSSIIAIKASQPSDSTYLFADGHPCEVDYSLFSQKEP